MHHIVVRGNERSSIFKDDHDRERFTMDATAAMHQAIVRGIERRYRVRFVRIFLFEFIVNFMLDSDRYGIH